jgi:hypothetical protein
MNENPETAAPVDAEEARRAWNAQRLEDRIAAQAKGKALQIVVQGKCRVCKRRSAAVPATKSQVMAWFGEHKTDGFAQYEVRMLETGVHRACQRVEDQKKKDKAARGRKNDDVFAVPVDAAKMERVIARRQRNKR